MHALTPRERLILGVVVALTLLAGVARYAGFPDLLAFGLAAIALAGLAWVVSFATEQVGERFGPAVTGVMQSTLGNLPELFVVVFALKAGETVVAQTSILGSLFANALLVLGLVIVVGARASKDGTMRFSARLPNDTATLLLLTSFLIVLLGLSVTTDDHASKHKVEISAAGAVVLLGVYFTWLYSYIRADVSRTEAPQERASGEAPPLSLRTAIVLLAVAGAGAAFVSDWFIAALN